MAASILRYELKGKARTRPEIFRLVLGPDAQCCRCEASEQKLGRKPKSTPKENVSTFDLSRKTSNLKKEYQYRIKNDRVMLIRRWQLAYFGTKVGYSGHIFSDIDFNIEFFVQSVRRSKSCNFGYI